MEIVGTASGLVRGTISGGVSVFRGIPYAAPPLGDKRWRTPSRHGGWTGVRDCRTFGPAAVQQFRMAESLFPFSPESQSEDCLTLNVWTGAEQEKRPVIVWLHPGAYQSGSGSAAMYDGTSIARAGAVLVTVNSRLAKLGFLAHPELVEEAGTAGNFGLRDQIAALEWVRENIAGFGGDPACVTLFGISSGASSVSLLMAAPAARGLFHHAIAESGGSFGPVAEHTGVGDRWQHLDAATRSGQAWADEIGAPTLRALRELDEDQIRAGSRPTLGRTRDVFDASRPIVDGGIVTGPTRKIFEAGAQAAIPLLVGSAANEDLAMLNIVSDLANYVSAAAVDHGAGLNRFLELYPAKTDDQAVAAGLKANGHRLFTWQNWTWANLHARAGHPVYYYRFERVPPVPDGRYAEQRLPRSLGAFHCASMFYIFDRFGLRPDWAWRTDDRTFSELLIRTWVSFARTGRPSASEWPRWAEFDPDDPKVMRLGDTIASENVPDRQYLDFWDRFYEVTS